MSSSQSPDPAEPSLRELRTELVQRRNGLSKQLRLSAAEQLAEHCVDQPLFRNARNIAVYLAVRGEADPQRIAAEGRALGKQVFVPVLEDNRLGFRAWCPQAEMIPNRFGILEPAGGTALEPDQLDLVFAPLVAFDEQGNRVGMGGGYYDRSFAFRQARPAPPHLVGLAYGFQRQVRLPVRDWDVPLDAVVTEAGWQSFKR